MIVCGEAPGGSASPRTPSPSLSKNCCTPGTPGVWRRGRQPGHRHRDTLPTLPSRRHTLRLTRITPTRSSSPTTTHEAAATPSTSPAHRSPPTAAPPSPASPGPAVKAPSPIPLATPLFCTTGRPALGSPSGSTRAAAVRASADTSPPLPRTRIAGPISAFTTAASTTESLAGQTTTQPLPLRKRMYVSWNDFNTRNATSSSAAPLTTVSLGAARSGERPGTFIRNVQITGDLPHGDLYIAGMDEGGGGFPSQRHQPHLQVHRRRQHLDPHLHWPHFPGPGVTAVGLLRLMFPRSRWLTGGTRAGVSLPPSTT